MTVSSTAKPPRASFLRLRRGYALPAFAMAVAWSAQASAQTTDSAPMTLTPPPASTSAESGIGFTTGLWNRDNLLGTVGGLRTKLANYGISVGLQDINEVLGNVSGGVHRGADYDGLTEMSLGLNTQKAFGWEGGIFNISALQIRGRNLSTDNLSSLQTSSGISASPTTRLWELWYQQSFLDGAMDVKIGQQSIDQEFMTSTYSGLFLNTMMGWPMLPSADMYAGGPAYPLSSPGVRVRGVTGPFTFLAGVFDDNPPGGPFSDDSQLRGAEKSGTKFNTGTGALIMAEVQYAFNQPVPGQMDTGESTGLPGTYKLGGWFDTADFPDQRFDTTGLSLADPNSSGDPRMRRHNWSLYGVADQMVWRPAPDSPQSLGAFARIMGAPGDRNLIDFSLNAGLNLKAPLPGRDDDSAGIGFGIAKVSNRAAGLDGDTQNFTGIYTPRRGTETFLEVTYQYAAAGWWQIQPDFQYIFRPGGGLVNPDTGKKIGDEAVFGLRSIITF